MKYKCHDVYILRTPLLPYNFFREIIDDQGVQEESLIKMFHNDFVSTAIKIAAPKFYTALSEWATGKISDLNKRESIKYTFIKYLIRMCTRATPFGIFAGVSTGTFSAQSNIILHNPEKHKVFIRKDMQHLVSISKQCLSHPEIRENVKWKPNTSLYLLDGQWRYIEYSENGEDRNYSLEGFVGNNLVDDILRISSSGKTLAHLSQFLVKSGIKKPEGEAFLNGLIENQILVSDLEPNIIGDDFSYRLKQIIENQIGKDFTSAEFEFMKNLRPKSLTIENLLKTSINVDSSDHYDLYPATQINKLNNQHRRNLTSVMLLFNEMTIFDESKRLKRFKDEFKNRYGEMEMPLVKVLDPDYGIDYLMNSSIGESTLLEGLVGLKKKEVVLAKFTLDKVQVLLNKKIQQALIENQSEIKLMDQDFQDFEYSWEDLPETMYSVVEIATTKDGEEILYINSINGNSAANLLARFSFGNSTIMNLMEQIVDLEQNAEIEKIVAEINHFPNPKIANVLRRPQNRKYEIPYLVHSILGENNQISIKDLVVSVVDDKITLRSAKHNKQIEPVLSCAHNYRKSSLPIYQFLCELGMQNKRTRLSMEWGDLESLYRYLPRVTYKGIILSKARWLFEKKDFVTFFKKILSKENTFDEIDRWSQKYNIPQYVQLVEGDLRLLINLKNKLSIEILLREIRNKKWIVIEEFIFNHGSPVKDVSGNFFTNQVVITFHKHDFR